MGGVPCELMAEIVGALDTGRRLRTCESLHLVWSTSLTCSRWSEDCPTVEILREFQLYRTTSVPWRLPDYVSLSQEVSDFF